MGGDGTKYFSSQIKLSRIFSFKNIILRCPESKDIRAAYFLFNFLYRKYGRFTDMICRRITYEKIGLLAEKLSGCI